MPEQEVGRGKRPGARSAAEQEEYEAMMLLDRLESLLEEMHELGVQTREQVERQIAALHLKLEQDAPRQDAL
jgi:hypothetical protein